MSPTVPCSCPRPVRRPRGQIGRSGLLVLVALTASCAHLPHVRRVAKGDPKLANVIYYALPRTVVTVQAGVRREQLEAGRCSGDTAWLSSRLGPSVIPQRGGFRFALHDWKVTTRAEPDPEAVFAITISSDMFDDNNQAIELSRDGFLVLDGAERVSAISAFTSSALELGGSLVAKAIPLAAFAGTPDAKAYTDHFCKEVKKRVEEMDTAETKLVSDAIGDPSKRANLELLLKEVRTTRDQLLLHFTGRVIDKNDYEIQCEFTPGSLPSTGDVSEQVVTLFSFDPKGGLVAVPGVRCGLPAEVTADMGGGTPIRARLRPAAGFAIAVRDSAMASDPMGDPSLYYRPASAATISIEDDAAVQASSVQTIAQLGPILWLPGDGDIRAFRAKYEIALHPETGALKNVAMTASGVTSKPTTSSGGADGSPSASTTTAQASEDASAKSEKKAKLDELIQERRLLEEQRSIDKLTGGQSAQ
jgi:hypothetical protein